jgi:3D (Asp-Asp-Asp) domain-containing protein
LTLTAASAALGASGANEQGQPPRLDVTAQRLDSRIHAALLSLYSLDSQLHAWQARLATLGSAAAELRQRRSILRQELGADRASLDVSQGRLALNLRALYERGNVDPLAVMLGASNLANGLRQLEGLKRVADETRGIVAATSAARLRLLRSRFRLAAEDRRLERSLAAARQAERRLAGAAAARLAYVSSLRTKERLRATQVQTVLATATAVQHKSQRLQPSTPVAPPPAAGGRQLIVSATCYDLPGTTATGMPVGWGVVAVDPSVIPLGSRLQVPGYGNGTAADVGSGIKGDVIDLWMPAAKCAAWGRRTVTITIY